MEEVYIILLSYTTQLTESIEYNNFIHNKMLDPVQAIDILAANWQRPNDGVRIIL